MVTDYQPVCGPFLHLFGVCQCGAMTLGHRVQESQAHTLNSQLTYLGCGEHETTNRWVPKDKA